MKSKNIIIILLTIFIFSCANKNKNKQEFKTSYTTKTDKQYPIIIDLNHKNLWSEIKTKAAYFKSNSTSDKSLKNLPEDFITFYKKFISDSLFQKKHVNFNYLLGAIGECDTTIILNTDNWEFINSDFIKDFTEGTKYETIEKWNNDVYIDNNKIYFEFSLREIGLIYQIGFEKINKNWILTLYKIDVC